MSIIPPFLKKGDKVAFAAPARMISCNELQPAIDTLTAWGLEVSVPDGLYDKQGQLAGSDGHRTALMQRLLDDESVKAIICCRGGYGSVRVIDRIDWSGFMNSPKWLVGYSDITVFHNHIHRNLDIATLHATMPINFPEDAILGNYPAIQSLKDALFGQPLDYTLECYHPTINPKDVEGKVVGGNLSLIYSLCGSSSDIDTEGKILLIEDLDEYLYHIDRMMQNLRRTGKLSDLKALVVGAMSDMHDNTIPFGKDVVEIVQDATQGASYPIIFTNQIGHVGTNNLAVPLGVSCSVRIVADSEVRISFKLQD